MKGSHIQGDREGVIYKGTVKGHIQGDREGVTYTGGA